MTSQPQKVICFIWFFPFIILDMCICFIVIHALELIPNEKGYKFKLKNNNNRFPNYISARLENDCIGTILISYLLFKEHIVLWASTEGLPDLVHIELDIQVIDLGGSGRWREQPSQNGSKI